MPRTLLGIADVAADHRGAQGLARRTSAQNFFQARNRAAAAGDDGAARGQRSTAS